MVLTVGTDCSGIDTPLLALQNMGIQFEHTFSCENERHAKEVLLYNHSPLHFYDDITKRTECEQAPHVDLYMAGFPCQPFSSAGKRLGFKDERAGILYHILSYIQTKLPKLFILENVASITKGQHAKSFNDLIKTLSNLGYTVTHEIMNTKDYGLPQNRERVYIVGRLVTAQLNPITQESTRTQLQPPDISLQELYAREQRPLYVLTPRQHKVVEKIVNTMRSYKWDLRQPQIIDPDTSLEWATKPTAHNISSCITRKAGRFIWYCEDEHGNVIPCSRVSIKDAFALQGMGSDIKFGEKTRNQVIQLIGNAMSVPVLESILKDLLLPSLAPGQMKRKTKHQGGS